MDFFSVWRDFIEEGSETNYALIAEGRYDDAVKKYPITATSGALKIMRDNLREIFDDRGMARYINFYAREMEKWFGENQSQVPEPGTFHTPWQDPAPSAAFDQLHALITGFHKNQQRLTEKDINKYTFETLQSALESLPESESERKRKLKDKETAEQDSEVVYDKHGTLAIRPLSTQASCYYGHNPRFTTWCISTKSKRNYFAKFTEEDGKAFVIIRFFGIPEDHPSHIIALELNINGDLVGIWDAPNKPWLPGDLESIVRLHLEGMKEYKDLSSSELDALVAKIYDELLKESKEWVQSDPPPDPMIVADRMCAEIEREANQELENISVYYEIESHPDAATAQVHFGATMRVSFDVTGDDYTSAKKDVQNMEYLDRAHLERGLDQRLSDAGLYGYDDPDVYEQGGDMNVELRLIHEGSTVDDFREFCVMQAPLSDKEHDDIVAIVETILMEKGYKTKRTRPSEPPIEEETKKYFMKNLSEKEIFYAGIKKDLIKEEKGRSRQRGIYKFYCMIQYALTSESEKARGLDDILADLRALENVTIVTVAIRNQKIGTGRYIAGLAIKYIPTTPGSMNTPENIKARVVRDIKRLTNVQSLFKLSSGLIRLE